MKAVQPNVDELEKLGDQVKGIVGHDYTVIGDDEPQFSFILDFEAVVTIRAGLPSKENPKKLRPESVDSFIG